MKKCRNRLRPRVGDGVDENLPTPTPTPVTTTDSGRLRLRLRLRLRSSAGRYALLHRQLGIKQDGVFYTLIRLVAYGLTSFMICLCSADVAYGCSSYAYQPITY